MHYSNFILFYVTHASGILKKIGHTMPSNYYLWVNVIVWNPNLKKASLKFSISNDRSPILLHQHTYLHHTQKYNVNRINTFTNTQLLYHYIIILPLKKPLQIHQVLAPVILHNLNYQLKSGTHFYIYPQSKILKWQNALNWSVDLCI